MILADASVWIDYLEGRDTSAATYLDRLLGVETQLIADLTLMEVLQGIRTEQQYERTLFRLAALPVITVGGADLVRRAAQNYRWLRARGITVRKTIATLIATRCIIDGHALLFSDRDFEPFVAHLGLIDALTLET